MPTPRTGPPDDTKATGFTLIEVVLTLALLTIALSALLAVQAEAAQANRLAAERHALIDIAAAALGRWRASGDAATACSLSAEQREQGFVCEVVEHPCTLSTPLRCGPEEPPGDMVEAILTVGRGDENPLQLRELRRTAPGSGR